MVHTNSPNEKGALVLRISLWLFAAFALNWFFRSIFVERFAANHGMMPSYHLQDIAALLCTLALAWFFELLGRRASWLQRVLIVATSLAIPIVLTFLLLTVGCFISIKLDAHGACL